MKTQLTIAAMCLLLVIGCNNKEPELQKQITELEGERATLQQNMAEPQKIVGEVVQAVNDVYKDVEAARVKESKLVERANGTEGSSTVANLDTRKQLLDNISSIGMTLKENQKKIANLQVRAKKLGTQIAGLNTVIENLKLTITEREVSIAALEARVSGLETDVAAKTQVINEKEAAIVQHVNTLNTAYYIIGTRDELEKKGIINDEGGFLWGLLGSTTVMTGNIDPSVFTPVDVRKDRTIEVVGKIDAILPARSQGLFTMVNNDNAKSTLTINDANKFWLEKYLVIVVDQPQISEVISQ